MINIFNKKKYPFILIWILFFIIYLFSAWIADDAYITFRTIENFHNGYGLRWNIDERVQTYTHPLWMINLLVGKYIISDLYYLSMILGLLYTSLTIYIVYKITENNLKIIIITIILLSSKAFLDFSSSGLENSLSHFLISLFIYVFLKLKLHKYFFLILSFVLTLMFLNRMDLVIPFLPLTFYIFFYQSYKNHFLKKSIIQGTVGFIPVIIWSIFSVYYYGSFFANSVIAKTHLGLPKSEIFYQGLKYLWLNIIHDPITSLVIYSLLIFFIFSKSMSKVLIGLGVLFHIIYIVYVGADYMYGRFLTTPFLLLLFYFVFTQKIPSIRFDIFIIFTTPFLIHNLYHYILNQNTGTSIENLTDERIFYYQTTGLLPNILGNANSIQDHFKETKQLTSHLDDSPIILGTMGFNGYLLSKTKPEKYIIDRLALTDPFLAIHPMTYGYWRSGHYARYIPMEYYQSLLSKKNLISEKHDNEILEKTWIIHRGKLNSLKRFEAIIQKNNGTLAKEAKLAFDKYPIQIDLSNYVNTSQNLWIKTQHID